MTSVLVTYGTGEGQTAKVAECIGSVLSDRGFDVTTLHASDATDVAVDEFDGILIGASINDGEHQPEVLAFVERHGQTLTTRPSGFFQLSLASAFSFRWASEGAMDYVEELVEATDWRPNRVGLFAGALKYTQYDRKTRWLFRLAALVLGLGTDTSRDYEYTDWDEVERFAVEFGAFVESEGERDALEEESQFVDSGRDGLRVAALLALVLGVAGVACWTVRGRAAEEEMATKHAN